MTSRPRVFALLAVALASIALAAGCSSDNGDGAAQSTTSTASSRLVDLSSVDDLRAAFNAKPGVPRLILLLSPTRGVCLTGASWVQQNILENYPDAKLAVYAVWLPMLATDARSEWDDSLLDDPRVRHFWDEERTSGRWFAEADLKADRFGPIVWDAYLLFGPDSRWDETPSALVGSGSPVIGGTDALKRKLTPLLRAG